MPTDANSTENQGFSNQGEDEERNLSRHTASLPSLANSGISPSPPPIANELPPSYESLLSSFVVTGEIPSLGHNPPLSTPRRPPEVNQHATVRYRGELNSNPDSFPRVRNPHEQATLHETTNVTESTSQEDHTAIAEEVSTRNSNERAAQLRSNAQLVDNNGSEYEDHSTNHNVTLHSNNSTLHAAVRESSPRQDNVPEENVASTSENTENIEPNTVEVEESISMALQAGSSDVITASRVSHIPGNFSLPTQQTDNVRASSPHLTHDDVIGNSVVDI